jgi:DNA-binding LacI/PurR family transcriptional regulator
MMTLKKISSITGYSVSTISKALNNKNDIKEDTKKMIQDVAFKSNYKPNKIAKALRCNKSSVVAIIVPRINHELYSELLYNIHKSAAKKGFRIMLFQSYDDISKISYQLEDITDGSVEAAVVLTINQNIEQQLINFNPKFIPVEFVQIKTNYQEIVVIDYCNQIFEKLISQTHQ